MNDQQWGPGGVNPPSDEETSSALESLHNRKHRRDTRIRVAAGAGATALVIALALVLTNANGDTKNQAATTVPQKATTTTTEKVVEESVLKGRMFAGTIDGLVELDASSGETKKVLVPESSIDSSAHDSAAISKVHVDTVNDRIWYLSDQGNSNCGNSVLSYFDAKTEKSTDSSIVGATNFALSSDGTKLATLTNNCNNGNTSSEDVTVSGINGGSGIRLYHSEFATTEDSQTVIGGMTFVDHELFITVGRWVTNEGYYSTSRIERLALDESDQTNPSEVPSDERIELGSPDSLLTLPNGQIAVMYMNPERYQSVIVIDRNGKFVKGLISSTFTEGMEMIGYDESTKTLLTTELDSSEGLPTDKLKFTSDSGTTTGIANQPTSIRAADIG